MTLLGNSVLLEPLMPSRCSAGGVLYSGRHRPDEMQYWVLGVGPGKRLQDGTRLCPEVRVGDKCMVNPNAPGVRHKLDDARLLVDADAILMIWQ